jgi:hypothetical protein
MSLVMVIINQFVNSLTCIKMVSDSWQVAHVIKSTCFSVEFFQQTS